MSAGVFQNRKNDRVAPIVQNRQVLWALLFMNLSVNHPAISIPAMPPIISEAATTDPAWDISIPLY